MIKVNEKNGFRNQNPLEIHVETNFCLDEFHVSC